MTRRRLTTIVTRTGDEGTTGLADGSRVPKDSLRIEAIGAVDELNSCIGLAIAGDPPADLLGLLRKVQQDLFDLGGGLSMPEGQLLTEEAVTRLEDQVSRLNRKLPPLTDFVLPGGPPAAASCHLARAVCRRAERRLWQLSRGEAVPPVSLRYLNRLSDWLFVAARTLCCRQGESEPQWQRPDRPG